MRIREVGQHPVQNWMNGIESMEQGYAEKPVKN